MDLRGAIFKLFSARVLLSIIGFGGIAYFTQVLGADAIGSFFLFQTVIGLTAIGSNLGLRRAAEKELSAGEDPGEVMATTVVLTSFLLIPFVAGILIAQPVLDTYIGIKGVSLYVALGLVATQARRLVIRLLAGQMRVGQTASLRIIGKLVWIIVGVALILTGLDALAILIGFIAGDLAIVLGALVRLDLAYAKPSVKRARSLLSFGYYIMLRSSGSYIYSWMDVAILGFFVPTAHVGAYEIAWRVAAASLQLTNAIRETIFPKISEMDANGAVGEIRTLVYRWIQPPVYLIIPGIFGTLVLGESVLRLPFGEEVAIATPVLVIFMGEKVIRTGHLLFTATIYAMDQPELGYRAEVTALSLNLILNLALIPPFGILGAALATTSSSGVAALISGFYLDQMIDLDIPLRLFGWSTMSAILMGVGVYVIEPYLLPDWVGLSIGVMTGVLLYGLLMAANAPVREEILSFRRRITQH
ncbi:polysaccharide biosynthesis C-terminal domain-containing protein [Halorubrum laminariae]|uniref:Polysaccharide biosynthesis C-terminal domain-containing protein n=1 Tax=Halorubrum laminariae TaxID=1433523 RepID=A0ABD6C1S1_9EURY|nr:polysaccharide biosynthesis C-terminal domain-containing protein [Halorubrum laminariae]